jgi:hypothetical protein
MDATGISPTRCPSRSTGTAAWAVMPGIACARRRDGIAAVSAVLVVFGVKKRRFCDSAALNTSGTPVIRDTCDRLGITP